MPRAPDVPATPPRQPLRVAVCPVMFPRPRQAADYRLCLALRDGLPARLRVFYRAMLDPRRLPEESRGLWQDTSFMQPDPEAQAADLAHFRALDPAAVDSLLDALAVATGRTPSDLAADADIRRSFTCARRLQAWAPDCLLAFSEPEQMLETLIARWLLGVPRVLALDASRVTPDTPSALHLQHSDLLLLGPGVDREDVADATRGGSHGEVVPASDADDVAARIRAVAAAGRPRVPLGARAAAALPASRPRDPSIPVRPFVVLGAPRCGTNLLVGLLDQHPDVVVRGELFNENFLARDFVVAWNGDASVERSPELLRLRREDPATFLDRILARARAEGAELFGFKLFYRQARANPAALSYLLRSPDLKVVHLTRRNLLRRRLSEMRAEATGQWHVGKDAPRSADAGRPAPAIDVDARRLIADFEKVEEGQRELAALFAEHDVLELTYEELASDPSAATERLCLFLGIRPLAAPPRTRPTGSASPREMLGDWESLRESFAGTRWAWFFDG